MDAKKRKFLQYSKSIKNLKQECIDGGMSEEEFKELYLDSLKSLVETTSTDINKPKSTWRRTGSVFLVIVLVFLIAYNVKFIYSCTVCKLQDFIYPGLKLLRRISIPIISLFPSLTEYYQETCLINNPFFTVVDMDCWPCSSVFDVKEIYDPKPVTQQSSPFIYKTDQNVVDISILEEVYSKHKDVLETEIPKILTNKKHYLYPKDLFKKLKTEEKSLYVWKFNTMNEARVLRQLVPRPKIVPKFGQSTERFIIVDLSQESFRIPDTECSYSFLISLRGDRTIELLPAEECKHQCKTLKVELKETYLLWYNWWYWRPQVQSSTRNGTFIAHIGSYC